MKTAIAWIAFLVALSPANLSAQEPLSNETVLKLVKAGIGEETIVGMVNQQPGKYSLSAEDVVALKAGGVSDKVIAAMIVKTSSVTGSTTKSQPVHTSEKRPASLSVRAVSYRVVPHESTT